MGERIALAESLLTRACETIVDLQLHGGCNDYNTLLADMEVYLEEIGQDDQWSREDEEIERYYHMLGGDRF